MKTLIISSVTIALFGTLSAMWQSAIATDTQPQFEDSERVSRRYQYRGTGRREILS
ncbi:MAG: hypothetical protein AAGF66_12955 [Cyanobacteria bacterium P01_H01_bin.119]